MRTTLDYIQTRALNNAAASSPGGSVEPVTGLRISTGTNSGDFIEITDAQAAQLSSNGLAANILTAGTGQTNGTFTVQASYGPAVLNYTIAGGALTAVSVTNSTGVYTSAFITANGGAVPTFTLTGAGTLGTVQAVPMQLFSGVYQRVKLTSSITSVSVGQALFWNIADTTDPYAVTNVGAATQLDFAGVVIDPGMGSNPTNSAQLSYAWIQCNGRAKVILNGTGAVGNGISFPISATNQFVPAAAPANPAFAGTVLVVASGAGGVASVRLINPQTRY